MAETTDPRTVPAPPGVFLAESPRVRVPSAELDQLRNECAALGGIRQAVIDLTAGRPDTHLMTVAELRAAVKAPPAAGVPLPVTWSGNVVGPTGGGPRAQTLLPLVTSYGTPACLALGADDRARLAGVLAATLHPAETCTMPGCGATEVEADCYADEAASDLDMMRGWVAVRVHRSDSPVRWWCSQACANSAIVAGRTELAAVDRADAAFAADLPQMMSTAVGPITDAHGVTPAELSTVGSVSQIKADAVRAVAEVRRISPAEVLAEVDALAQAGDEDDAAAGGVR